MRDLLTQICDFLWFGYVPSIAQAERHFARYDAIVADEEIESFDWHNIETAKQLLVKIVAEQTVGRGINEICLPLSSGLDSRALLGAALEVLPADKIIAYTLGHEGTADFEKARQFSLSLLPVHHRFDSVMQVWSTADSVKRMMKRPGDQVTQLGEFAGVKNPELSELRTLPKLKGFLGDALSGKKLPSSISGRWVDAVESYASKFRTNKGPLSLTPEHYDPCSALPRAPFVGGGRMLIDDQVQFAFRQEQQIRQSFSQYLAPNSKVAPYIFPFDDRRWVRSFLLLPTKLRKDQVFYKHLLASSFPKVFPDLQEWRSRQVLKEGAPSPSVSLPEQEPSFFGRLAGRLRQTDPRRQTIDVPTQEKKKYSAHIDFGFVFDHDASFRQFCRENLNDLARRDIIQWVDIGEIIRSIENGNAHQFGRSLYGLLSLEINLKANKFPIDA